MSEDPSTTTTTKHIDFRGGGVTQGLAKLVFPAQSFDQPSGVTISEVSTEMAGRAGPLGTVYKFTFAAGKPLKKPTLTVLFSQVSEPKPLDLVALADGLVLRRLSPDRKQWLELVNANVKRIVDPLFPGLPGLLRHLFRNQQRTGHS